MKYALLLSAFFLFACSKSTENLNTNIAAKVVWTGTLQGDGCDWAIQINSKNYHPDVLSPAFQLNNLNVIISYKPASDTFHCGFAPAVTGLPVINVINIQPVH